MKTIHVEDSTFEIEDCKYNVGLQLAFAYATDKTNKQEFALSRTQVQELLKEINWYNDILQKAKIFPIFKSQKLRDSKLIDTIHSHPQAVERYRKGDILMATQDVAENPSYGFGEMDDYGFFEFPLYFLEALA